MLYHIAFQDQLCRRYKSTHAAAPRSIFILSLSFIFVDMRCLCRFVMKFFLHVDRFGHRRKWFVVSFPWQSWHASVEAPYSLTRVAFGIQWWQHLMTNLCLPAGSLEITAPYARQLINVYVWSDHECFCCIHFSNLYLGLTSRRCFHSQLHICLPCEIKYAVHAGSVIIFGVGRPHCSSSGIVASASAWYFSWAGLDNYL